MLLKVSDNVIKTRPTPPLFTSKPDAKIMGKIANPASIATKVSRPPTVIDV